MLAPLYCDNHLLALDKPAGLLTQPSGTVEDSLEAQGKALIRERFGKPGAVFLEAVHRLDRPVCGVVLFARTSKALARLNAAMRAKTCRKHYRAVLTGRPPAREGTLEDWLLHDDFHAAAAHPGTPGARFCRLAYRVTGELAGGRPVVEIELETGRYHQIRAQFALRGCPLAGDSRYGAPALPGRPGVVALQHLCLETPHPTRPEERLMIRSALNLNDLF